MEKIKNCFKEEYANKYEKNFASMRSLIQNGNTDEAEDYFYKFIFDLILVFSGKEPVYKL